MLILTLYVADSLFGIRAKQVAKVLPMCILEAVPNAPQALAGLLHYNEQLLPVVDLNQMLIQRPCTLRRSTRIVLIDSQRNRTQAPFLGLIAERVTETVTRDESEARDDTIDVPGARYLGEVFPDPTGSLRMLSPDAMLTEEMKQVLRWNQEHPA